MLNLILLTLVQACISALIGGIVTWITGKFLKWDELTFGNSVYLNATLYLTSPIVPVVFFFFEYYIGSGSVLPMLAPDIRLSILLLLMTVVSVLVWVKALNYIFGWDMGQSCIYCCAQGCVVTMIYIALGFGLFFLISTFAAASAVAP